MGPAQRRFAAAVQAYRDAINRTARNRKRHSAAAQINRARQQYLVAEAAAAEAAPGIDALPAVTTISDALDTGGPGSAVRLVGRVSSCSTPELWGSRQGISFEIEDKTDRGIETCFVFLDGARRVLGEALDEGFPVEVLATVVPLAEKRHQSPVLGVHAARRLDSALAAIGATQEEIDAADERICDFIERSEGALAAVIAELRRLRGVASDGMPAEFLLAEKAVVFQAMSKCQLADANPRLHVLVIGRPGSGKKILSDYERILEPVSITVQASTVTRAGLAAGAVRQKDRLVARPGIIPRAHLGVVRIEDLHGLRPGHRDQVFSVLAQAMEDGRLDLSNAAYRGFVCETAFYLDLNRKSQLTGDSRLRLGGTRAEIADIGLRVDLLSRIDLIFELESSTADTEEGAVAMLDQGRELPKTEDRAAQERRLQVMMALLRHWCDEVDLAPAREVMKDGLRRLLEPLRTLDTPDFDPATFERRMANSMQKLVAASARLHGYVRARRADVDLACELLTPKVNFIRNIATAAPSTEDKASRYAVIQQRFGGQEVSPQELMDALGIPRRTVHHDLEELGEKTGYGKYRIRLSAGKCANGTLPRDAGEPREDDEDSSRRVPVLSRPGPSAADCARARDLTPDRVGALNVEEVHKLLTAAVMGVMSKAQVQALGRDQITAFTVEQLKTFPHQPFYEQLTATQATWMSAEQAKVMIEEHGKIDQWGNPKRLDTPVIVALEMVLGSTTPNRPDPPG